MAKQSVGIVRPILTHYCKNCGKMFARCHPKDTQEYCERCRKKNEQSGSKSR